MKDLQQELGLTYLFVSHNLAVVDYVSDEIAVMCGGRLVELAPRDEFFNNPAHPYTRALLAAVPYPDPDLKLDLGELLEGKSSDSNNWPEPFTITAARAGKLVEVSERHFVRMREAGKIPRNTDVRSGSSGWKITARQKAFAGRTFSLKNGSAGLSTWQTWRKLKIIDGSKQRHQTVGCLWICQVSGL